MQVGVDVTCMRTNFGGRDLFGFGDTATFKKGQIKLFDQLNYLMTMDYIVHGHEII